IKWAHLTFLPLRGIASILCYICAYYQRALHAVGSAVRHWTRHGDQEKAEAHHGEALCGELSVGLTRVRTTRALSRAQATERGFLASIPRVRDARRSSRSNHLGGTWTTAKNSGARQKPINRGAQTLAGAQASHRRAPYSSKRPCCDGARAALGRKRWRARV